MKTQKPIIENAKKISKSKALALGLSIPLAVATAIAAPIQESNDDEVMDGGNYVAVKLGQNNKLDSLTAVINQYFPGERFADVRVAILDKDLNDKQYGEALSIALNNPTDKIGLVINNGNISALSPKYGKDLNQLVNEGLKLDKETLAKSDVYALINSQDQKRVFNCGGVIIEEDTKAYQALQSVLNPEQKQVLARAPYGILGWVVTIANTDGTKDIVYVANQKKTENEIKFDLTQDQLNQLQSLEAVVCNENPTATPTASPSPSPSPSPSATPVEDRTDKSHLEAEFLAGVGSQSISEQGVDAYGNPIVKNSHVTGPTGSIAVSAPIYSGVFAVRPNAYLDTQSGKLVSQSQVKAGVRAGLRFAKGRFVPLFAEEYSNQKNSREDDSLDATVTRKGNRLGAEVESNLNGKFGKHRFRAGYLHGTLDQVIEGDLLGMPFLVDPIQVNSTVYSAEDTVYGDNGELKASVSHEDSIVGNVATDRTKYLLGGSYGNEFGVTGELSYEKFNNRNYAPNGSNWTAKAGFSYKGLPRRGRRGN